MNCWKNIDKSNAAADPILRIGEMLFTPASATEEEIREGEACIGEWTVERQYQSQVCGGSAGPTPYYERKGVTEDITLDELIFFDGECVGIYHEELIMLFGDENTHFQKKWIGEFIIGPDRTHDAYDYYVLKRQEQN